MRVFLAILGICGILAAGCGSAGGSGRSVHLKALALQPSDVQSHLLAGPARYWSNAQAAKRDGVPVSSYDAHGRIRSYENDYTPDFSAPVLAAGLERADSEITAYKGVQGAHWGWLRLRATMRKAKVMESTTLGTPAGLAAVPVPFKQIAVPRVGNEDAGFAVTWGGDEFAYTTRDIVFRQGRYVALVRVIGIMDQFSLRRTLSIARAVDRRIASSA
jgi:hypothetical protein